MEGQDNGVCATGRQGTCICEIEEREGEEGRERGGGRGRERGGGRGRERGEGR